MTETEIFPVCSYEFCDDLAQVRGLCGGHSAQRSRGEELSPKVHGSVSPERQCSVDGCSRVAHSRGVCFGHYQQQRNGRALTTLPDLPVSTCSSEGCSRIVKSRGMCASHYNVWRVQQKPPCSFDGCERRQQSSGLCKGHADQRRAGKELTEIRKWVKGSKRSKCLVENCGKVAYGNDGLCATHTGHRARYCLSVEDYLRLPSACEVCGSTENLTIDHDHACCPGGRACQDCVRGILCRSCNVALGFVRDSTDILQGLINYLEDWRSR